MSWKRACLPLFLIPSLVLAKEPISPLKPIGGLSPDKVALGSALFRDVRLSKDNSLSCLSCHDLASNGTDNQPVATGINNLVGVIKTPTVYNSAYNFVQFWDGRSRTLEAQVSGPIHNPVEFGSHWGEVIKKLSADEATKKAFRKIYADGVTAKNIADAIATYERSLITTGSRFDKWLEGDENALTEAEKEGYKLFKAYGCISCHQGRNVGGNMYARMGNMRDYFAEREQPITLADLGRYNVTKREADRHLFKVPSLRLASMQQYFFHDSSQTELTEAVKVMARYQLGRSISPTEIGLIVEFIHSLAGKHPEMEAE